MPRITKSLWRYITNAISGVPASTDLIPYAPQPGTPMVSEWQQTTVANLIAGGGGVIGPGSSTDKAVARWDGTTGKLLENSVAILDDTGRLVSPASLQFGLGGQGDPTIGGDLSSARTDAGDSVNQLGVLGSAVRFGAGNVTGTLKGAQANVFVGGSGNIAQGLIAHHVSLSENGTGNVAGKIIGILLELSKNGAGTGPAFTGILINMGVDPASGNVTSIVGLRINTMPATKVTSDAFGILIEDQSGDGAGGRKINILSQGASSQNTFEGNVEGKSFSAGGTPGFNGTVNPVTSITVKNGIVTAVA